LQQVGIETIGRQAVGGLVDSRLGANCACGPNTTVNEYTRVGGVEVGHDLAGNLTGDHRGYSYVYDYENRIIEVRKSAGTELVASYEYDALGRRIEVVAYDNSQSPVTSTTTRYYYDGQRAVVRTLVNTAGSEGDTWSFVYGNYIDEVLLMIYPGDYYCFYAHDHLYSPVTLTFETSVIERYEFQTISNIGFTGRELDVLDNGSLKIMYYRARYYDLQTGRFTQRDPLGINPAGGIHNPFAVHNQHQEGLNLYEYVKSNSLRNIDPHGTLPRNPPPPDFPKNPPKIAPKLNAKGSFACCSSGEDAIAIVQKAFYHPTCREWFTERGADGQHYDVRVRGNWKGACAVGAQMYTWPISNDIAICKRACDNDAKTNALLLIHELAHHYCTIGPDREECANSAMDACANGI